MLHRIWTSIVMAIGVIAMGSIAAHAQDQTSMAAYLNGTKIDGDEIHLWHCDDASAPVIQCYRSEEERDDAIKSHGVTASDIGDYVTVYADENYDGGSFTMTGPYPNLSVIGWNDVVTSFKSRNGRHPRFYRDSGYGAPWWQWTTGAWIANVGSSANDQFSSIKNVP